MVLVHVYTRYGLPTRGILETMGDSLLGRYRASRELPLPTDEEVFALPGLLGRGIAKNERVPNYLGTPKLVAPTS